MVLQAQSPLVIIFHYVGLRFHCPKRKMVPELSQILYRSEDLVNLLWWKSLHFNLASLFYVRICSACLYISGQIHKWEQELLNNAHFYFQSLIFINYMLWLWQGLDKMVQTLNELWYWPRFFSVVRGKKSLKSELEYYIL